MFSIFILLDLIGNIFISTNFTLTYVILASLKRKYHYKKYIFFLIGLGLLYDLIFTDIYFLNSIIFLLVFLFIKKYKNLNAYILGLICILFTYFFNFIISLIFNNTCFDINYTFIYIIVNYLIFIISFNILKVINK